MAEIEALTLTTANAASSYGRPVLVIEGEAYGPADMTPAGVTGAELVTTWGARFTGQAAGDLRGLLREVWARRATVPDWAGDIEIVIPAELGAAIRAALGE